MTYLLDVNMLVALAWPRHLHHEPAHRWFAAQGSQGWATCPMTQCGFVRVLTNRAIMSAAVSTSEALKVLRGMTAEPSHTFWPDSVPLVSLEFTPDRFVTGHRQITDYYLLGTAITNNGILVTLDRGVESLLAQNSSYRSHVLVLAV